MSITVEQLQLYQRATNYLAAAQVYLQDNVLLQRPLEPKDIKPRLLGHWGTCPGINMIYAHLNRLICQYNLDMFLVTGPGHGAAANIANIYLEGTLQEYYPQFTFDTQGLKKLIRAFSWPGGFPSHLYPGIPGTIHEGGELGYALATSFGAIMDNPNLIVACIVGDGEAETGPTATAWHSYKFIDPVESGAVLPIIHLNGYKIASPTIYGTMSNEELTDLFTGYGYQPLIVELPEVDVKLYLAMDKALSIIHHIQKSARSGDRIQKPKWPVIILKTPKGMSGPKVIDGVDIEGSNFSHQVPAKDVKTNKEHLKIIENWLLSYHPEQLFDQEGHPTPELFHCCPKGLHRMGMNPHANGGLIRTSLVTPNIFEYEIKVDKEKRGVQKISDMHALSKYISKLIVENKQQFRIFSPDELESNQLKVLDVTHRNYQWPLQKHDQNIGSNDGRVLEVLSEHNCQGWMQGYVLTGRYGLFPSYEAFFGIVTTMIDQFAKYSKTAKEIPWRKPVASLNYLASSTLWRQEHNGFSHQNPGLINSLLNKKGETVRIYFPPDANCLISTMDHCFRSLNYVNLVITGKNPMPQWLTMEEAVAHCRAGASVWKWASTNQGLFPDVVMVGIGDDVTIEVLAAVQMLREHLPTLNLRVINITDLLTLESDSKHPHGMDQVTFEGLFTSNRPVIFNFHGYPTAIQQLLYHRGDSTRFIINGYQEEGTTTTPFDMMIRNKTSRFHLALQAIKAALPFNPTIAIDAQEKISTLLYKLRDHRRYIETYGDDPEEITSWVWKL
ncbi:Xylulose-5-phosphate phosphoketolase [Candidatus Rubidus massiliensis]|nr:MAG: phosphoketolase [Chlamydia sp. 32-24]CDZ79984.1 Xylulose-5-phosphate phosphoketolase [Candidatus Rubidus massiliensis]